MKNFDWANAAFSIGGKEITGIKSVCFTDKFLEKQYKKIIGKNHHRKFINTKEILVKSIKQIK